jgi:FkbM family methyltransferase
MKLHHNIANLLGYELSSIKKHHPTLESHLQILFGLLKIDAVFDVGANKGQYGRMLRKTGYTGTIFSFEPVQSCFQELAAASAADADWHVFNYALGAAETASMDINVMDASEFSSLLQPNAYAKDLYAQKIPVKTTETISVKRLDDIFSTLIGDNKYKGLFLKMDTQGYDLKVLTGATQALNSVVALQSEISVTSLYEGMPDYIESLNTFRQAGFELTGLYPVSRDPSSLRLIELDCVMRRLG